MIPADYVGDGWDGSYSVGHPELDRQHQEFLEMITDFLRQLRGGGEVDMTACLQRIVHYAIRHFDHEERLLHACGYADLAHHVQEHRQYRAKAEDLVREYVNHNANLPQDVLDFLQSWFVEHILNADRRYADLLAVHVQQG